MAKLSRAISDRSCEVRCLRQRRLGRCHLEGRALILQVTNFCQCRHRIATTLKDSFTFGVSKEMQESQITSVLFVASSACSARTVLFLIDSGDPGAQALKIKEGFICRSFDFHVQ